MNYDEYTVSSEIKQRVMDLLGQYHSSNDMMKLKLEYCIIRATRKCPRIDLRRHIFENVFRSLFLRVPRTDLDIGYKTLCKYRKLTMFYIAIEFDLLNEYEGQIEARFDESNPVNAWWREGGRICI